MSGLAVYRVATGAVAPLVRLYLRRRLAQGKEDRARLGERRGEASRARPDGPLVWLHAASVGESQSALALIGRIIESRPDIHVLVTSGTVTSARLLERRLPPRTVHQFVPVDLAGWVRRFHESWRPDLALFVESELWPNLILETAARGCPLVLVNGRLSTRSFERWRRAPGVARTLLRRFALCLGQTEQDCERLAALGAPRADFVGNLKYSAAPLPADDAALSELREAVGDRPLWLAASTHPGEEALAAGVHEELARRHPGLLTVIVPRHPARGEAIAAMLSDRGLTVRRRGTGTPPAPDDDIYLADTLGELGTFYRLAEIAFIGGSTTHLGGHNPLEAAQLGCAVLHGPDMANFRTIAADLKAADAAVEVADGEALTAAVDRLLRDGDARRTLASAARKVTAANGDALDRVMAALAPFLDALPRAATDCTG